MDVTSYLLGKKSGGGGPTPTGTINITENGTHDVTNYASANVNVSGGSIETINDVNEVITNYGTKLDNVPSTYETLTQNATTLYCPASGYTTYWIYKNVGNKYRIGWGRNTNYENWGLISQQSSGNYQIIPCKYQKSTNTDENMVFSTNTTRYYSTSSYETLEECITAIQSNQTSYNSSSSASYYLITNNNSLILSNAYCIDDTTKEFITPQRISSNETIEVKS